MTDEGHDPIELTGVRYQYAGSRSWALDGADLRIASGSVVGLIGPNDSGKSTLCLVAAGLAPAVTGGRLEGSVWLVDQPTVQLASHEAARRCGILFQNPRAQLSGTAPTVWEEVAFGPRNLGQPLAEIVKRVDHVLDVLRIAALAPRDPARLSGGQAQLVAFASVLALEPRALILDEPTSQLDPEGTRLVGEAIRRVATETGAAVLVVEHKTDLLAQIADRITVLDGGRTVLSGASGDVLADATIVDRGIEPPPWVRIDAALRDAGVPADQRGRVAEVGRRQSPGAGAPAEARP